MNAGDLVALNPDESSLGHPGEQAEHPNGWEHYVGVVDGLLGTQPLVHWWSVDAIVGPYPANELVFVRPDDTRVPEVVQSVLE